MKPPGPPGPPIPGEKESFGKMLSSSCEQHSEAIIFARPSLSLYSGSTLLHYISFEIWVVKYSTGWEGHIWGCRL